MQFYLRSYKRISIGRNTFKINEKKSYRVSVLVEKYRIVNNYCTWSGIKKSFWWPSPNQNSFIFLSYKESKKKHLFNFQLNKFLHEPFKSAYKTHKFVNFYLNIYPSYLFCFSKNFFFSVCCSHILQFIFYR
jgi:hypothetical protein